MSFYSSYKNKKELKKARSDYTKDFKTVSVHALTTESRIEKVACFKLRKVLNKAIYDIDIELGEKTK